MKKTLQIYDNVEDILEKNRIEIILRKIYRYRDIDFEEFLLDSRKFNIIGFIFSVQNKTLGGLRSIIKVKKDKDDNLFIEEIK